MARSQDPLNRATAPRPGGHVGRTATQRRVGWVLALGSAVVILGLTLVPAAPGTESPSIHCLICGRFGLANLIRNVVLFVPLGMGLGLVVRRFAFAWLPAVALTTFIEIAQFFIPGRNPLLIDLVANATGAAIGILFVRSLVRGSPPGRRGLYSLVAPAWWGLSAATLAGTAFAFQLALPSPPHFIQIQADLAHFDRYAGTVESVRLLDERLTIGRYPDPEVLEERIFGGAPAVVEFVRGPDPRRIAPLLSIYTGDREELFVLGLDREDAVLRLPYRALRLRLDRPDHRVRGVMAGLEPGDAGRITYRMTGRESGTGGSACVRVEEGAESADGARILAEECGMAPTLGQGWTLLLYPSRAPEPAQRALGWAWLFALGLVPGLFAGRFRIAVAMGGGLVAVGALAPWALGSMATFGIGQALWIAAGTGAGWWVMRATRGAGPPGS